MMTVFADMLMVSLARRLMSYPHGDKVTNTTKGQNVRVTGEMNKYSLGRVSSGVLMTGLQYLVGNEH